MILIFISSLSLFLINTRILRSVIWVVISSLNLYYYFTINNKLVIYNLQIFTIVNLSYLAVMKE